MDAELAVARQLVDAFTDALRIGDLDAREYAEQQLADFVDELDDGTSDGTLVALLDLPLDEGTFSLLHDVSARLSRRGPGVVAALLEAAVGEAPPDLSLRDVVTVAGAVGALLEAAARRPDLPDRTANACSVMDAMAQGDLILGLIEVLEAPGGERLKRAAAEMLVDIGQPAVSRLEMSLHDRDAEPWVSDVLVDIREGREPAADPAPADADDPRADEAAADGAPPDSPVDDSLTDPPPDSLTDSLTDPLTADAPAADALTDTPADDTPAGDAPTEAATGDPAGGPAPLPGAGDIDREYEAFVDRFKRETGQG